jgi:uncharacterized membrane protein YphA (DoxX/SURF4 family)
MNAHIADDRGAAALVRRVFGGALALVGLMHLIFGEEPTRLFPVWAEGLPGRPWWAHAAGALLMVLGVMVALGRRDRGAAAGISVIVLLAVLTQHLPRAIPSGALGNAWLSVLKFAALAAGAALVPQVGSAPAHGPRLDRALRWGAVATPWLMGAFMAYSGYLHLRYTASVTRLLPPWMPWQMFWIQFTGVALVAGGVGLVTRPVARIAALLTAAMILGFFLLVHIPRTLADPLGSTGWLELGESTAFVMIALLLARRAASERALHP